MRWPLRRVALFGVVGGVMVVSIHSQVEATRPLLGEQLSALFAITLDVGSLIALNEVLSAGKGPVRRWGWFALSLSAGLSGGLSVWHAVNSGALPLVAAIAVGAGPVILAGVLSHLLALSLGEESEQRTTTGVIPPVTAPAGAYRQPLVPPGAVGTSAPQPMPPAGTGSPSLVPPAGTDCAVPPTGTVSGTGTTAGTRSAVDRLAPRDVPPPVPVRTATASASASAGSRSGSGSRSTGGGTSRREVAGRSAAPCTAGGADAVRSLVEELPPTAARLWNTARELDRHHRKEHGTPIPRRVLMAALEIGTTTAAPLHKALAEAAENAPATGSEHGTVGASSADTGPQPKAAGTDTGQTSVPPAGPDAQPVPAAGTSASSESGTARARLALVGTGQTGTAEPEPAGTSNAGPQAAGTDAADPAEAAQAAEGRR